MARSENDRSAVRRGYIQDRLPLSEAARQAGVPPATARNWKRRALISGDNWDRAREAARIASAGLGSLTERVLRDFATLFTATMSSLKVSPSDPVETAKAMATLADAYAKTVRAAGAADPRLARLSIAMEILDRLGQYIQRNHPHLVPGLIEVLEPFGAELAGEWN